MTFAAMDADRSQLVQLSILLLAAFPGSIIYRSSNLLRMAASINIRNVDVVFADADACAASGFGVLKEMRMQRPDTRIYLLCRQDTPPPNGLEAVSGFMIYPITEQKLRNVLQIAGK